MSKVSPLFPKPPRRRLLRAGGRWTELLEHPNRRRLCDIVRQEPGINFRSLVKKSGIAAGTTRHHLTKLVRGRHLIEKGYGIQRVFFPYDHRFVDSWPHQVLLREVPLRAMRDWIAANPQQPQTAVLNAFAAHGWSRSTTQHRLQRLEMAGVLHVRWRGRYKLYSVPPVTNPAAPTSPTVPIGIPAEVESP
jgi:predicted transcriptional regulator